MFWAGFETGAVQTVSTVMRRLFDWLSVSRETGQPINVS